MIRALTVGSACIPVLWLLFANGSYASESKIPAPTYLKEARIAIFMANEVTKYCKELVVDEPSYKSWFGDLEDRLASEGITNINEQVESTSTMELLTALQRVMDENGGPFRFNPEKYCAYGRKEILQESAVGTLLMEREDR